MSIRSLSPALKGKILNSLTGDPSTSQPGMRPAAGVAIPIANRSDQLVSPAGANRKRHDRLFRVLLVEEHPDDRHLVAEYLEGQGMAVTSTSELRDIKYVLVEQRFDLVIFDLSIGKNEGLSLIFEIRSQCRLPLIVTTASQVGESERAAALELGADDCVAKPFLRELTARIRAVLRRSKQSNTEYSNAEDAKGDSPGGSRPRRCRFGGWQLDRRRRKLTSPDGADVSLTKSEYALLIAFIEAPKLVLSREQLLQATRIQEDLCDRSIDVQIMRLRRKLNPGGGKRCIIRTVRGVGYMFMLGVENME